MDDCDLECADEVIYWTGAVETGAAFVASPGLSGGSGWTLGRMVRLVYGAIQLELAGGLSPEGVQRNPKWWNEGTATLVGMLAIADVTGKSRDERRRRIADEANNRFEPLWDLEDERSRGVYQRGAYHAVGAAAVDLLASQVGLRKLTEFYTDRIDGEEWQQTFLRVFNISVPEFYELFHQHHWNGYPLRELPITGSTDWP